MEAPAQVSGKRSRAWAWAAVSVVFAAAAARLLWFVHRYAVNVVFWDQWDYLDPEFNGASLARMFLQQQGTPRQGIGAWVIAAVHQLSGWDGRVEAFAAAFIMLIAGVLAIRVAVKLTGRLSPFDAAIPLTFATIHAFELYIGTVNLAHGPIPVLLVVGFVLAMQMEDERWRLAVMLGLNFLAIYTGFGICLGVVTVILFAAQLWGAWGEKARRVRLGAALVVAVLSLASFRLNYEFQPSVACFKFPDDHPTNYVWFASRMFVRALGGVGDRGVRVPVAFAVYALVVGTGVWSFVRLIRSRGTDRNAAAVFVFTAFSIAFTALTAVGRVCTGVEMAESSRYVGYTLLGIVGVYLALRASELRPQVKHALLVAVVLLFAGKELLARQRNRQEMEWYANGKRAWVACYLRIEDIHRCDEEAGFQVHPSPELSDVPRKLQFLKQNRYSLFKE